MTAVRYAQYQGVDEKQVRRWVDHGLPHQRDGARYCIDPVAADKWVKLNAQPRDDQSPDRLRLIRERADKVALANAVQRGELLRLDHVSDVVTSAFSNLVSQLDSIAGRLANEIAAEKKPSSYQEGHPQ